MPAQDYLSGREKGYPSMPEGEFLSAQEQDVPSGWEQGNRSMPEGEFLSAREPDAQPMEKPDVRWQGEGPQSPDSA